jgi:hypothetical protein
LQEHSCACVAAGSRAKDDDGKIARRQEEGSCADGGSNNAPEVEPNMPD